MNDTSIWSSTFGLIAQNREATSRNGDESYEVWPTWNEWDALAQEMFLPGQNEKVVPPHIKAGLKVITVALWDSLLDQLKRVGNWCLGIMGFSWLKRHAQVSDVNVVKIRNRLLKAHVKGIFARKGELKQFPADNETGIRDYIDPYISHNDALLGAVKKGYEDLVSTDNNNRRGGSGGDPNYVSIDFLSSMASECATKTEKMLQGQGLSYPRGSPDTLVIDAYSTLLRDVITILIIPTVMAVSVWVGLQFGLRLEVGTIVGTIIVALIAGLRPRQAKRELADWVVQGVVTGFVFGVVSGITTAWLFGEIVGLVVGATTGMAVGTVAAAMFAGKLRERAKRLKHGLVVVFIMNSERLDELDDLRTYRDRLESRVIELMDQAIASAFSKVLGTSGSLPWPDTPQLVEMKTDRLIASEAQRRTASLLSAHQTLALGIVGPRGSGKTTLLQQLRMQALNHGDCCLYIQTPVDLVPLDFVRDMANRIVVEIRKNAIDRLIVPSLTNLIRPLAVLLGCIVVITTGFYLPSIFQWVQLGIVDNIWTTGNLGGGIRVGIVCALLLTIGTVVAVFRLKRKTDSRGLTVTPRQLSKLCLNMERRLGYLAEFSSESSIGLEEHTVLLGRRRSKKLTEVSYTYTDIVRELHGILSHFSDLCHSATNPPCLVVLVDELDKVERQEDRLRLLMLLKDLFRLSYVKFVVTIADNDNKDFSHRRFVRSTPFDSCFDEIIQVQRMSPREACEIVLYRTNWFPGPLALLCYIWANGRPRDVIRFARDLAERGITQMADGNTICMNDLISDFIHSQINALCDGEDVSVQPVEDVGKSTRTLILVCLKSDWGVPEQQYLDKAAYLRQSLMEATESVWGC